MVAKVGSAGQVIESVIQYQSNSHPVKPAASSSSAPEKKDTKESRSSSMPQSPLLEKLKNSDSSEKGKTSSQNSAAKTDSSAVMETSQREVIEDRATLELSPEALKITVDDVNDKISNMGAKIEYSYHEETKRYSFKIKDVESGEVLKEVPSEKSLDMVAKMFEMAGLIVDEKR